MEAFSIATVNFCFHHLFTIYAQGGGGGTPLKEANGDVPLDGSHFHDWIDYNGVAFSIESLEWGCKFSDFWGK